MPGAMTARLAPDSQLEEVLTLENFQVRHASTKIARQTPAGLSPLLTVAGLSLIPSDASSKTILISTTLSPPSPISSLPNLSRTPLLVRCVPHPGASRALLKTVSLHARAVPSQPSTRFPSSRRSRIRSIAFSRSERMFRARRIFSRATFARQRRTTVAVSRNSTRASMCVALLPSFLVLMALIRLRFFYVY